MALVLSLQPDRAGQLGRVLVILAAVAALMIVSSVVFGVHLGVADYRIAPDPAGNLPF
jgi:membrane-associated phospholipid phosphatase